LDHDPWLRHGPTDRVIEDRELQPGEPKPSTDNEQNQQKQEQGSHGAIMTSPASPAQVQFVLLWARADRAS